MKHVFSLFKLLLFCVAILCANHSYLAQSDTAIYKTIGGIYEDEFKACVFDNDSNLVFCGNSSSLSQFGSKAILVKTDSLLNTLWAVSYGEYAVSNFTGLVQDGDTYIAVGSTLNPDTSYDILVAAYNEAGNLLWDKHIGGENWDLANSIRIINGGYLITADTYTSTGKDALVIKIDTSGELLWQQVFGGDLDESLLDGRESLAGDLIFCGNKMVNDSTSQYWFLKTNPQGEFILEIESDSIKLNSFNSIVADPFEESYYAAGHMHNPVTETMDATITKLNSDGFIEYNSIIEFNGTQSFYDIQIGSFPELLCIGFTKNAQFGNEGEDFLVKRHDLADVFISQGTLGTSGDEIGSSAIRISNGYIFTGYTNGLGQGQKDGFIIRARNNGSDVLFSTEETILENVTQTVSINTLETLSDFSMTVSENGILFSEPVHNIEIYSLTGALIYSNHLKGELELRPQLNAGIYLIKTDGIFRGKLLWL